MPAPTMATSSPCRSAGMLPSPAGCSSQSSKPKGKSGPKMVMGFFAVGGVAVVLVHEVTLPERLRGGRSLSIGDAWWSF